MSSEQCWARQPDGTRCEAPALGDTFVCAAHTRDGIPPNPMTFFRAPEAQMPPALVDLIRRYSPGVTFPPAAPEPAVPAPPPAAAGPAAPESLAPAPPPSPGEPAAYEWLLAYLREAISGLMASDSTPLQKANAMARLSSHYLKAAGAGELKRESKELTRRVAELEQRATAAEARLAESEALVSLLTERHETIAAAPANVSAPDRLPASAVGRGSAGSPLAASPDPIPLAATNRGDHAWDTDDPSPTHPPAVHARLPDPVTAVADSERLSDGEMREGGNRPVRNYVHGLREPKRKRRCS